MKPHELRAVRKRLNDALTGRPVRGRLTQAAVDLIAETGSATAAILAARADCAPEAASNALRGLWARGILAREPAPHDGKRGKRGFIYTMAG